MSSLHSGTRRSGLRGIAGGLALVAAAATAVGQDAPARVELANVAKIWDRAPHCAFTDLVRWRDAWYCAFREGQGHAGDRGNLRILTSVDGQTWTSVGLLEDDEFDLRDAALAVTPDDRLMVLGGNQRVNDGTRETGTFVSFSADGREFSPLEFILPPGRWLWRTTWHGGVAYGVSYPTPADAPHATLLKSSDGRRFEPVVNFAVPGNPTEARVRFDADGVCYCLQRRDGNPNSAYWGRAVAPYEQWEWHDMGRYVGGPNFLQIPSGAWIGCGRLVDGGAFTEVFQIDPESGAITRLLRLPSGGDTSYPGLVWHDDRLWISYYSSHEQATSIYLAQVRF